MVFVCFSQMNFQLGFVVVVVVLLSCTQITLGYRTWVCSNNKCVKQEVKQSKDVISMKECKARCLKYGGLWPKPTGVLVIDNRTSPVDVSTITFEKYEYPASINRLLYPTQNNFLNRIKEARAVVNNSAVDKMYKVRVVLELHDHNLHYFSTNVDESYKVVVTPAQGKTNVIKASVKANTFFGLRHGLETLSQLFFYDDYHKVYKMMNGATIEDKPAFTHRGILLDTVRSHISVDNIMNMLEVMAANKLNTFHWHITDSHSFPYVSEAYPQLSQQGAYSEEEVYTQSDIKKITKRARVLGIRVIPELAGPARAGEGWDALGENLITCFKWEPWPDYCAEPPCGQFDPTNETLYEVLGTLVKEYVDLFHSEVLHMGGYEVNLYCWKSTPRIVDWMDQNNYEPTDEGYYRLWGYYYEKLLKKLREAKTDPHPQAILWTSTLTDPDLIGKYLRPEDYIIQIWNFKQDTNIKNIIKNKFSIIFSNYDELNFDCGKGSWMGDIRSNCCLSYIGWQCVYEHSPLGILRRQGINVTDDVRKLVLGSEAVVWTQVIDDNNLQVHLWPRAAALAERLWSDPEEGWKDAQYRMNHQRERMVKLAPVELLQPKSDYKNNLSLQAQVDASLSPPVHLYSALSVVIIILCLGGLFRLCFRKRRLLVLFSR